MQLGKIPHRNPLPFPKGRGRIVCDERRTRNMPSVLSAGCGYVGSAAAKLFAEERWEVIGWTRSEQSAERSDPLVRYGGGRQALHHLVCRLLPHAAADHRGRA